MIPAYNILVKTTELQILYLVPKYLLKVIATFKLVQMYMYSFYFYETSVNKLPSCAICVKSIFFSINFLEVIFFFFVVNPNVKCASI